MRELTGLETIVAVIIGLAAVLLPFCRFKAIDRTVNLLGLALFAVLVGHQAVRFRQGYWTIGPYLTPVEVIAPDGRHCDGTEVTPADRFDSPAFYWCIYAICGGCLAWDWRDKRQRKRLQAGRRR